MIRSRLLLPLLMLAAVALAGCSGGIDEGASFEDIAARAYHSEAPASLTLYTVVSNSDNSGAHTALMVNASQQVLFDPAGSFKHPQVPERGDVLYGFTPRINLVYIDYHARKTYRVFEQTVQVPPDVAEQALQLVMSHGAVPQAQCSLSTTSILSQLPGFEYIGSNWFPLRTSEKFGEYPGATFRVITDEDADDNHGVIMMERDRLIEEGYLDVLG